MEQLEEIQLDFYTHHQRLMYGRQVKVSQIEYSYLVAKIK